MFSLTLQTRPGDCDGYGHVNNAVYVSHFEQTLAGFLSSHGFSADWGAKGEGFWTPQSLTLEYRLAAGCDDPLEGRLWLAEANRFLPVLGFEILGGADISTGSRPLLFRAMGVWVRRSKGGGEPQEIPFDLLAELAKGGAGSLPRMRRPVTTASQVRRYSLDHRVGRNEAGPTGHIHLQPFYRLLEESLSNSCEQAGWPTERWLAAGYFTVQTRHETEILSLPRVNEVVRVTSQLIEVRRLGGTWQLDVRRASDGELLAKDHSTGVHLNLDGRPASPPPEILAAIQFG
jgi:acyl-CoA thioester hydrolase